MRTLTFIILLLFSIHISYGQENKLPSSLLSRICNRILELKNDDKYFNAEILGLFTFKGGDYFNVVKEVENICIKKENQNIFFEHIYDKFETGILNVGKTRNQLIEEYFYSKFGLTLNECKILADYIDNLNFLDDITKKAKISKLEKTRNKEERELEIQSKTYDLFQIDENLYRKYYYIINKQVFTILATDSLAKSYKYVGNVIYDKGQLNIDFVNNYTIERNYVEPSFFTNDNWKSNLPRIKVETVLGEDLFKVVEFIPLEKFPLLKVEGFYVKSKATYWGFRVKLSRGECEIKKTKKSLEFILSEPKNQEVKNKIIEEINKKEKGTYKIIYSIGKVNELEINEIKIERKE